MTRALDVQGDAADDLRGGRGAEGERDQAEQHPHHDGAEHRCFAAAWLNGGVSGFERLPEDHGLVLSHV